MTNYLSGNSIRDSSFIYLKDYMKLQLRQFVLREWQPFLFSSIAILVYALFINLLSWRYMLVSGGSAGYALVINYVTDISVGSILFVANTLLIALAFVLAGIKFGARSIYGYALFSIAIDFFRSVLHLQQIEVTGLLLGSWYTGLFGLIGGIAVAVIVAYNYSLGGYTILVPLVQKYLSVSTPNLMLLLDVILGIASFFLF